MKDLNFDRFIVGTVAVILLNGLLLFILNISLSKLLSLEQYNYKGSNVRYLIVQLLSVMKNSGFYQYIYIVPAFIWQLVKKKLWLGFGILFGSWITLFIYIIKLAGS
ncbi:MAG: hypothetical protein AAFO95_22105 [Cyanobacteria bacterium J06600_6]